MARAAASSGHRPASGWRSARVSQIARLSHTVSVLPLSSIFSTGTLPDGECFRICSRVVGASVWRSRISTVSKGAPVAFSAT